MELTAKHKQLENCQLKVDVEIPPKELQREYEAVKKDFVQYAQLPGFRKGKVPIHLIDKKFKPTIKNQVLQNIIPKAFQQAVDNEHLKTFGKPIVENIGEYSDSTPLSLEFKVDRIPSVDIKKIDDLELIEDEITIGDLDIEEEINRCIRAKATLEDCDEAADIGYYLKMNVTAEGEENGLLNLTEYPLELKPSNPIPYDLLEDIRGLKKGEKKSVEKTFPLDHIDTRLKGKSIKFEIELTEVKKIILPELTDDLAKELNYDSRQDLKTKCKLNLENYVERYQKNQKAQRVLEGLVARSSFEIPNSLIEMTVLQQIQNIKAQFQNNEQLFQAYLSMQKQTMSDLESDLKEQALKSIKNEIVLDKLQNDHKLEVEEEELVTEIQKIAEQAGRDVKELRKEMIKSGDYTNLKNRLIREKTIDLVAEKGKIQKGISQSITQLMSQSQAKIS